jgi:hypothetical protein
VQQIVVLKLKFELDTHPSSNIQCLFVTDFAVHDSYYVLYPSLYSCACTVSGLPLANGNMKVVQLSIPWSYTLIRLEYVLADLNHLQFSFSKH